jgi:predicted pyridoxine 5'-phosphate oxidase superfamily flavin-nucleotide-binding protein
MLTVATLEELEKIYSVAPVPAALVKERGRLTPDDRALIEASPFVVLATSAPEGLDCSPRGDRIDER